MWLGFHDMHQEGNYVTLSSGGGKFCYSNWHRGEPNNYGKSEHCATFRSTTRTWNDAHCKEIMNYICKKIIFLQKTKDIKKRFDRYFLNTKVINQYC